jgi:hypothetical protein
MANVSFPRGEEVAKERGLSSGDDLSRVTQLAPGHVEQLNSDDCVGCWMFISDLGSFGYDESNTHHPRVNFPVYTALLRSSRSAGDCIIDASRVSFGIDARTARLSRVQLPIAIIKYTKHKLLKASSLFYAPSIGYSICATCWMAKKKSCSSCFIQLVSSSLQIVLKK